MKKQVKIVNRSINAEKIKSKPKETNETPQDSSIEVKNDVKKENLENEKLKIESPKINFHKPTVDKPKNEETKSEKKDIKNGNNASQKSKNTIVNPIAQKVFENKNQLLDIKTNKKEPKKATEFNKTKQTDVTTQSVLKQFDGSSKTANKVTDKQNKKQTTNTALTEEVLTTIDKDVKPPKNSPITSIPVSSNMIDLAIKNIIEEEKNKSKVKKYVVGIASYNRYAKLVKILDNVLSNTQVEAVIVLDDNSEDEKYLTLSKKHNKIKYIRNELNYGKKGYWHTITKMLKASKEIDYDYLIQIDDDFNLGEDFVGAIEGQLKNFNKDVILRYIHFGDKKMRRWGLRYWVDGGAVYPKSFLKKINFKIDEIPRSRWSGGNEHLSSGVWHQISEKINNTGYVVYNTETSFASHGGNEDSKMNANIRTQQKLIEMDNKTKITKPKVDLTVILTAYNRPETLIQQIQALDNQSVDIPVYWLWYNKGTTKKRIPVHPKLKVIDLDFNLKYHGRFALALLARTEYVAVMDDDILPQSKFFESCFNSMKIREGMYGANGVFLKENKYTPNEKFGWLGTHNNNIEEVDIICHLWFFKTDWAKYMWFENPPSWDNGEDIHFSYMLQKHKNIPCLIPPHPNNNLSIWGSEPKFGMQYGNDQNATHMTFDKHYEIRNELCVRYIKDGWKLTKNKR